VCVSTKNLLQILTENMQSVMYPVAVLSMSVLEVDTCHRIKKNKNTEKTTLYLGRPWWTNTWKNSIKRKPEI